MRRVLLTLLTLSAGAGLAAILYGARMVEPQAGPSDSYGAGPIGHRVLAETLERMHVPVFQNRGDDYARATAALLFLEPGRDARVEGRLRWLADAISERGDLERPSIVVLPKWRFGGGSSADGSVVEVDDERMTEVIESCFRMQGASLTLRRRDAERPTSSHLLGPLGEFAVDVPRLTSLAEIPAGATTLLQSEEGAVVIEAEDGTLVLTDPDLVHSFNFHRADHAALFMALLERLHADSVVIDESFHGHGRVLSLSEALGKFPAILIVAQMLLLLVLLFAFGSRRFGPPEDARHHRFGPAEAIAVTASVLAQGQSLSQLSERYVQAVLDDVHQKLGLPEARDVTARADAIDAIAAVRHVHGQARSLLARAATLSAGRLGHAEAWRVAREAYELRRELIQRPTARPAAAATARSSE